MSNNKNTIEEYKNSLNSLKNKILKLKEMCSKPDFKQTEANEILSDGLLDLITIKKLNTIIKMDTEKSKNICLNEQKNCEEKNINFQNYLYQKEIIINQINLNESISTPEINKIYKKFDKNNVTLEKLNNEFLNRKKLYEKYEQLNLEKENNLKIYKEKENFIKSIPITLTNIENETIKVQNLYQINITEKIKEEKYINKLPKPLFIFYNLLKSYNNKNLNFYVEISGNENDIENFFEIYKNENYFNNKNIKYLNKNAILNEEDYNSETEDNFFNLYKHSSSFIYDKKIDFFPLFIILKISNLEIKFKFYPILNIVTCECNYKKNISSEFNYSTEQILSNIFKYKENFTIINKKTNEEEEINLILSKILNNFSEQEKFYEYIQILCNNSEYNIQNIFKISLINKENYFITYENIYFNESISNLTIDNFINNIIKRKKIYLPSLFKQTDCLLNNNNILDDNNKNYKNKIKNFSVINQNDYYSKINILDYDHNFFSILKTDNEGNLSKIFYKEKIKKYNKNEANYYNLEIKNNIFTTNVYIEIGFDYPFKIPNLKIFINENEPNKNLEIPNVYDNIIKNETIKIEGEIIKNKYINIEKEIEYEINDKHKYYFLKENNKHSKLFSYQLKKLLYILDILYLQEKENNHISNFNGNLIKMFYEKYENFYKSK
jgi:hypothetical protein